LIIWNRGIDCNLPFKSLYDSKESYQHNFLIILCSRYEILHFSSLPLDPQNKEIL